MGGLAAGGSAREELPEVPLDCSASFPVGRLTAGAGAGAADVFVATASSLLAEQPIILRYSKARQARKCLCIECVPV